jgi:ATPase subunit of ABC transporter with duplicated ATPase domains
VRARIEALKNQQRIHDAQAAQIKHISAFVDRFRYNANRAALVQSRLKKLEKMTLVPEVLDGSLSTSIISLLQPSQSNTMSRPDIELHFPQPHRIASSSYSIQGRRFRIQPREAAPIQELELRH